MADEHEFGTMDTTQNRQTWQYFVNFWKYFFIILAVILVFLAFTGT